MSSIQRTLNGKTMLVSFRFSWEAPSYSLRYMNKGTYRWAQLVRIGMPIVCWKTLPPTKYDVNQKLLFFRTREFCFYKTRFVLLDKGDICPSLLRRINQDHIRISFCFPINNNPRLTKTNLFKWKIFHLLSWNSSTDVQQIHMNSDIESYIKCTSCLADGSFKCSRF